MDHESEAHRTQFGFRRRRITRHSLRLLAVFLLCVWVGPVTFVQTDGWSLLSWAGAPGRASATATIAPDTGLDPRVIPAGQALVLEPGTPLTLHLRNGSVVRGRFLGRALLDSALYVPRFEEQARSSPYAPFALGETLHVSLLDGREWTAPFAGYAELTLLLAGPDSARYVRVPFEFARGIRRANGDPVAPSVLIHAFHAHYLPSAEALVLGESIPGGGSNAEQWAAALRVPVDDIESALAPVPGTRGANGWVVVAVLGAAVLLVVLLTRDKPHPQPQPGCEAPGLFNDARLSARPFDRARGCFVGDPIAVADPWPGAIAAPPLAALPDTSGAVGR